MRRRVFRPGDHEARADTVFESAVPQTAADGAGPPRPAGREGGVRKQRAARPTSSLLGYRPRALTSDSRNGLTYEPHRQPPAKWRAWSKLRYNRLRSERTP